MKCPSVTLLVGSLLCSRVLGFTTMPMYTQPSTGSLLSSRDLAIRPPLVLAMSTPLNSPDSASSEEIQAVGSINPFETEFLDDVRKIGADELINGLAVFSAFASAGFLLYQIDASISHHGVATLQDIITRIPMEAWGSYSAVLNDSPIATKAVTSATVYTIGDVIAQRTQGNSMGQLDRPRILRSLLAGLIGHGPLSHFWYIHLDDFFNNVLHITEWWSFVPKIMVDQTLWGPIWNNTYILLLGIMKLDSFKSIWSDMKRTTIPLIVSSLKLWPLAHCITYGLIPVEHRLLWVDLVEILWVTILATQTASSSESRENAAEAAAPSK